MRRHRNVKIVATLGPAFAIPVIVAFQDCAGRHNFRLKKHGRMTITLVNRAALHAGTAGAGTTIKQKDRNNNVPGSV